MNHLFMNKGSCNPDIGDWNVSNVTNFVSQSIASMHVTFYLFISKTTKQSLTPFFCLSNIATTPIMKNNIAQLIMLSQNGMFYLATAFNQDISNWNVGSGTNFVSGLGLWESWSSRCFRLLIWARCLCLKTTTATMCLLRLEAHCGSVAFLEGLLYCSCILYYNYTHCQHQTKSGLTPFLSLSNIATTPIINNNTSPLLLLSQNGMFSGATAFNQEISDWDVSSGIYFVSGLGLWESLSCCCFHLLSWTAHCRCCCCGA